MKLFLRKNSREMKHLFRMDKICLKIKVKCLQKVLYEVCQKFDGAGEFINQKIEEVCCQEKLLVEEVPYFVYKRLHFVVGF